MLLNFKLNLILKNYISIIKMQSKFSVGKIEKKMLYTIFVSKKVILLILLKLNFFKLIN